MRARILPRHRRPDPETDMNRAHAVLAAALVATACTAADETDHAADATTTAAAANDWWQRPVIYEVFVRSFSPAGDLRGVIAGLDRIADSGANVVWLMPVQPVGVEARKGTLGSPYAIADYRAIDPAYGSADDLRALIDAVHQRGMKLILDWVPNHTARDHAWIDARPDFYIRSRGAPAVPRDSAGNATDWTDVAQLDYANAELRTAMIGEMRYWLDEFGIDGFRVDMAGLVPASFWHEAVPALRDVERQILLLAEWGDAALHEAGFDLTYGWEDYHRLKAIWQGARADSFAIHAAADVARLPAGTGRLRFTTNHDETANDGTPAAIFGGAAGARAAFTAMALLPGAPLIYQGQEIGSTQQIGLFDRQTLEWTVPDAEAARTFHRRIVQIARTHADFASSALTPVVTSAPDDVIAYARGNAVVLVNTRPRAVSFTVTGYDVDRTRDLLTGSVLRGTTVSLMPHGALVLAQP
jgi:alpha-amylase